MTHALDILDQIESPAVTLASLKPRPWAHASCSQITTHERCARRWWLGKVAGLPEPTSPALDLGKQIHAELEAYLLTGAQPGPIAAAGVPYLPPPPVPRQWVERRFAVQLPGSPVPLVGAIDLIVPNGGDRHIIDHKTISDPRYAKTPEQLATDTQALLYAAAVQCTPTYRAPVVVRDEAYPWLDYHHATNTVTFAHVTYLTRGAPKSSMASVVLEPDRINSGVARLGLQLDQMGHDAAKPRPDDVSPNPESCRSYGRMCPFRSLCDLIGDAPMLTNPFAKKTTDVAAINAAEAASASAPPPPPLPGVVAPAAPPPLAPPPLSVVEGVARKGRSASMNRNAARPGVVAASNYPGYSAPSAELAEAAIRNVYGNYENLGDAAYALSEYRRLGAVWTRSPEDWQAWIAGSTKPGVPVPTLWDIACYVLDGSVRAEAAGYTYEPAPVPVETLPPMPSEEKAAMMAPPAPPASKPRKGKESIPDHPAIPEGLRGMLRQHISLQAAPRTLTALVVAAREAGHDIQARGHTKRGELLAEIADVVHLLTGERPWGADADESAEAPPAPPVPSTDTVAATVPPAPPVPAPSVPPPPPAPPVSSDAAGGASPSVLYIDCLPVRHEYIDVADLSEWLVEYEEQAAAALKVPDYRLAKFREGDRLIASLVYRALRDGTESIPPGMIARSSHPLADVVLPIISQYYDVVVQGIR